jgi:GTPase-associated adaptor domain/Calcineurin-like phosphoesterase
MLLIHLSDIHFRAGEVGTAFDPNQMLRAKLVEDAKAVCESLNDEIGAILVSGDIAYAGKREEFDFATGWLEELAHACGASLADVFSCPGNHDADRAISKGASVKAYHQAILSASPLGRNALIAGLLQDGESNKLLMKSIRQYNSFAQQFFCSLSPEETVAKRALSLNDGSVLRLWALNSTLVSSEDDEERRLVVDPAYNQILRKSGEENLIICHHPPIWLKEGHDLQSHLNASVRLQLFGHEHDHRVLRDIRHMQIFAGAVVPERDKAGWEPGYNVIQLKVTGQPSDRKLEVGVHARVWQRNPILFRAKKDENGSDVFLHSIPLSSWAAPAIVVVAGMMQTADVAEARAAETVVDPMDSVREIGIRFFKLTLSQRASIAGRLNLLEQDDEYKSDFERYRDAFRRAQERQLVKELDEAVKAEEKK